MLFYSNVRGGKPKTQEYLEFEEIFLQACEKHSPVQKVIILKSLLEFPAAGVLTGLRLTAENYNLIMDKLKKKCVDIL